MKRILIAVAALLGFGTSQALARTTASVSRPLLAAAAQTVATRELQSDDFGGYGNGLFAGLYQSRGNSPRDWGMSRACARMVRKNRLARARR